MKIVLQNFYSSQMALLLMYTIIILSGDGPKAHGWQRKQVRRPNVVNDYNVFMGGVDKSDQLIGSYCCLIKSRRWWKALFFHIIRSTLQSATATCCSETSATCTQPWHANVDTASYSSERS